VGGFFYWIIVRHTAVRLTNNKWALWRSFAKVPNFRKAENNRLLASFLTKNGAKSRLCKRAEAGILHIRSGIFLRCAVASGSKLTSTAMQKSPNGYADISRRPTAAGDCLSEGAADLPKVSFVSRILPFFPSILTGFC